MAKFGIIAACILVFTSSSGAIVIDSMIITMRTIKEQVENSMEMVNSSLNLTISAAEAAALAANQAIDASLTMYNENIANVITTADEINVQTCLSLTAEIIKASAAASSTVKSCIDSAVTEVKANFDEQFAIATDALSKFNDLLGTAESCDTSNIWGAIFCPIQFAALGITEAIASMQNIATNIIALQSSVDGLSVRLAACGSTTVAETVAKTTAESLVEILQCGLELGATNLQISL